MSARAAGANWSIASATASGGANSTRSEDTTTSYFSGGVKFRAKPAPSLIPIRLRPLYMQGIRQTVMVQGIAPPPFGIQ